MATTNATAPKGASKKSESKGFTGIKSGGMVILACFIIAESLFYFGAGHVSNFVGAPEGITFALQAEGTLESANLIGTVYHGGFIVPIIWTLFITVFALTFERYFAIRNAYGRSNLTKFVADIKSALRANDLEKAQKICDAQRGSVAAVVGATLKKYKEVEVDSNLTKEQKILAIQKELEEATALEMPTMQENLPIIGTIVSLGTLMGLLGTVMGMIVSFQAMGSGEGGADSSALSKGISEALVNTASGIATGALATVAYNYFTNKIDRLTFCLDEVGFSIVQSFSATH